MRWVRPAAIDECGLSSRTLRIELSRCTNSHVKLLEIAGEVAEWLKAAVC